LKRREAWTFAAVVVTLVALGVAPRPLVNSRFAASDAILRLRRANLEAADRPRSHRNADSVMRSRGTARQPIAVRAVRGHGRRADALQEAGGRERQVRSDRF